MEDVLRVEHYKKAIEILADPAFEEQELLLFDYVHGYPHGAADDIAGQLTGVIMHGGLQLSAYILNDELKASDFYPDLIGNTRFKVGKYKAIKLQVERELRQNLKEAIKEEKEFLLKKKTKEEIHVPLVFEGKEFFIVKYSDNQSDEYDVEGFHVFTSDEWEEWKNNLPLKKFSISISTNDYNKYRNRQDFLDCCDIKPISIEYAKMLFDIFGRENINSFDFNGRYFNKVVYKMEADYGEFPFHMGIEKTEESEDASNEDDDDYDDDDYDDDDEEDYE